MKLVSMVFVILFCSASFAATKNSCIFFFDGDSSRLDSESILKSATENFNAEATDELIVYLSLLLENKIFGSPGVVRMIEGLKKNEILNPILEDDAKVSSSAFIHRQQIQQRIESGHLNIIKLVDWSKAAFEEINRVRQRRNETRGVTEDIHHKMQFHRVNPKPFEFIRSNKKVQIRLTHPFVMMSTPVTQKQWVELMGENPSGFNNGHTNFALNVHGNKVKMQPDNPVENMTWWSALEFANRLSLQMGFEPTYDFSDAVTVLDSRAENGTLYIKQGKVKINAPGQNIYKAKGFRLPTSAEYDFMFHNSVPVNEDIQFTNDLNLLESLAWFQDNSDSTTHPVAELQPYLIEGNNFYDLYGNVWEWANDKYDNEKETGIDPQGPTSGTMRVQRGGGYCSSALALRFSDGGSSPQLKNCDVGFRLVRSLP